MSSRNILNDIRILPKQFTNCSYVQGRKWKKILEGGPNLANPGYLLVSRL